MKTHIEAIGCYFPETVVTNEDLKLENPSWDMDDVQDKAGVLKRYIVTPGETALDLAIRACEKLFKNTTDDKNKIDGIIFCTQSPDYIMPSNSHLLHKHLDLGSSVFAFDINLACSGYVYGLAMANAFIVSGLARRILFVTAETYSKYIHAKDRSARVLFGDGAAATLLRKGCRSAGTTPKANGSSRGGPRATSGCWQSRGASWSRRPISRRRSARPSPGSLRPRRHPANASGST